MIAEIQSLLDEYALWLKSKTTIRQTDDWVEITTPHLDRHNDALQIYARTTGEGFLLTDGGYILADLEMSGVKFESKSRKYLLQTTLQGFGVRLNERRLEVSATRQNWPLRKHNLVQAMLAVNDMFMLSTPHVASLFVEDVAAWLETNEIRYTGNVKFAGKTGYDHRFDFVIPKSRLQPERIIRAINYPDRDSAETVIVAWIDTKDVRPPDSLLFAFLNDSERSPASSVAEALQNWQVTPVFWTQKDSILTVLAA